MPFQAFDRFVEAYLGTAANVRKICGFRSQQIAEVLGAVPYEEVVYRDNLVVIV